MKMIQSNYLKKHIYFLFLYAVIFSLFSMTVYAKDTDFTVTDLSATATLSTDSLNVRRGPGKDYDSIGKVSSKDTILITGQASTGWYQIDYNGKEGYISDSYVTITEQEPLPESSEYIEGDSQKDPINYTLLLVIIVILIVILAIIVTTFKTLTGNRTEEEDDEYEEYNIGGDDKEAVEDDSETSNLTGETTLNANNSGTIEKEEDYRIFIDPIYFKDGTTTSPLSDDTPPNSVASESDKELEDALTKLNKLQQEIEQLKEKRK